MFCINRELIERNKSSKSKTYKAKPSTLPLTKKNKKKKGSMSGSSPI